MKDLENSINKLKDRILYLDARSKNSELSNKEKDQLNKDLMESNDRLGNFIEIYNDIINEDEDNKINTLNDEFFIIKYAIKNKNLTSAEKNELQNKIKELETQKNSINSKFCRTIKVIKKKKESEKSKTFMKKYDSNGFDENGVYKNTFTRYNPNGFDRDGFDRYGFDRDGLDRDGLGIDGFYCDSFDENGIHKHTFTRYNFNGFDRDGFDRNGRDKDCFDRDGFDKEGLNKYTFTRYNTAGFDRDGFNKDGFAANDLHKDTFTTYNPKGFEKDGLHKITFNKYDPDGYDIYGFDKDGRDIFGNKKKSSKSKTSKAKSFMDQKGKGHINLPIALSKVYTNDSSKELINNIKQLINDFYDTKKITKQVYNMLNKTIIHVQNTTF